MRADQPFLVRSVAPPVLFFVSLIALPCFALSTWVAGIAALGTAVAATSLIIRRPAHRGLLIAALALGSVGIVIWMLDLLLLPSTIIGTVTIGR